jgi:hypothetical protein
LKPGEESRIRALIAALSPKNLASRVRFIVTEMPWDFPIDEKLSFEERDKRQIQAVEEVARELLRDPPELQRLLSELSTGEQRMAVPLGVAMRTLPRTPDTL